MFRLALALLQVARQLITILERQKLLTEGRQQQIALELAATAKAAAVSAKIRAEVDRMDAEDVDHGLRGDFRD